jgi:hypothetical protein
MRSDEDASPHVRVMRSDEAISPHVRVMRSDDGNSSPFQERYTRIMRSILT